MCDSANGTGGNAVRNDSPKPHRHTDQGQMVAIRKVCAGHIVSSKYCSLSWSLGDNDYASNTGVVAQPDLNLHSKRDVGRKGLLIGSHRVRGCPVGLQVLLWAGRRRMGPKSKGPPNDGRGVSMGVQ